MRRFLRRAPALPGLGGAGGMILPVTVTADQGQPNAGGALAWPVRIDGEPATISTANSTTTPLGGGGVFTGTAEDVSGFSTINVAVFSDQASATGGLSFQFSTDGTNWDHTRAVTISASTGRIFTLEPGAQFFRIVYTNGGTPQGAFRLETLYRVQAVTYDLTAFQDVNATQSPTTIVPRTAADIQVQAAVDNVTNRVRSAKDMIGGVGGGSLVGTGMGVLSGASFFPALGDASGRLIVIGGAADATALAGNPVLVAGSDGVNARTLINKQTSADNVAGTDFGVKTFAQGYDLNGTNWDRRRNNNDVTLLTSASRTTTQTSADITTYNLSGINVIVDITAIGTGSITLSVDGKDPASGKYYNLLTGIALVGNGTTVYKIGLGETAVANATANDSLPRTIRIVVTANNANAVTYSVGYTLKVQ